ncbi:hypothetical protein PZN02_004590 [Sinorhizobium garamanticum]|uniref:Transcriptional regulator, AbiEi antitoxin, Type IV TA system n=1 Tax=Sinorhizobium garamanticum TaxID=680247 RepID=A0ABY8DJ96_9HYPH|nr:hypothetical protein [Sinorhizobium garamanticum]WEX90995.1 hypothetical protein PZN02_004590 [Sinorhizobium garamanticum]
MARLDELKQHLIPGKVYRRADLTRWTASVDRDIRKLLDAGELTKLSGGVYVRPKPTSFGRAPASDHDLVEAFLKDKRFLLLTPNAYNALGVGATQLYNETVVYNRKRHGRFKLGNRVYDFRMKPEFPAVATKEFLLVDLVNSLKRLAEDETQVLERARVVARELDQNALRQAAEDYGGVRAKKFFKDVFAELEAADG